MVRLVEDHQDATLGWRRLDAVKFLTPFSIVVPKVMSFGFFSLLVNNTNAIPLKFWMSASLKGAATVFKMNWQMRTTKGSLINHHSYFSKFSWAPSLTQSGFSYNIQLHFRVFLCALQYILDRAAGEDIPLMLCMFTRYLSLCFCFGFVNDKVQICFSVRKMQLAKVSLLFGSAPRLPPLTCSLFSAVFLQGLRLHSCDGREPQHLHKTLAAFHASDWARIGEPPLRCIVIRRQVNPGSTQNCGCLWR